MLFYYLCTVGEKLHREAYPQGAQSKDADVFKTVTKIGTGLSDDQWREVRERCEPYVSDRKPARVESNIEPSVWVEPQVVIEVLADEITRSPVHPTGADKGGQGYALRFPRIKRIFRRTLLSAPGGLGLLLFGMLITSFIMLTILATVGGALGAKVLEKE